MLTADMALAAISVASLPVRFSTGAVVGKGGAILLRPAPFPHPPPSSSPALLPCCPAALQGVQGWRRVGQIAARFTLLAAYYGAATLPPRPGQRATRPPTQTRRTSFDWGHPRLNFMSLIAIVPSLALIFAFA